MLALKLQCQCSTQGELAAQLAAAAEELHAGGIAHGSISPFTVMRLQTEDQQALRFVLSYLGQPCTGCLSPQAMLALCGEGPCSPQPACDVFAIAATVLMAMPDALMASTQLQTDVRSSEKGHLLCPATPDSAQAYAHGPSHYSRIVWRLEQQLAATRLPAELKDCLAKCLQADAAARPAAAELKAAVEAAQEQQRREAAAAAESTLSLRAMLGLHGSREQAAALHNYEGTHAPVQADERAEPDARNESPLAAQQAQAQPVDTMYIDASSAQEAAPEADSSAGTINGDAGANAEGGCNGAGGGAPGPAPAAAAAAVDAAPPVAACYSPPAPAARAASVQQQAPDAPAEGAFELPPGNADSLQAAGAAAPRSTVAPASPDAAGPSSINAMSADGRGGLALPDARRAHFPDASSAGPTELVNAQPQPSLQRAYACDLGSRAGAALGPLGMYPCPAAPLADPAAPGSTRAHAAAAAAPTGAYPSVQAPSAPGAPAPPPSAQPPVAAGSSAAAPAAGLFAPGLAGTCLAAGNVARCAEVHAHVADAAKPHTSLGKKLFKGFKSVAGTRAT